jgi:Ca-activated chloride channel family protein
MRRRAGAGVLFSMTHALPPRRTTWRTALAAWAPLLVPLGLALAVVALARPRRVFSQTRDTADVIAIQMVVDISGSMAALDMSVRSATGVREQTRLDAVKSAFEDFIRGRPDDLAGLIVFGGYASTLAPLTADHAALIHVLKGVQTPAEVLDAAGRIVNQEELMTAIGDALATACARLENAEPRSKIVVLLSDGESNTGVIAPEEAVEAARKLGIKVYTIGVGTSGRVPFRARDMFGRQTVSYAFVGMDEALLKRVAAATGGRYFNVRDPDGLARAMEDIDKLEKTRVERDVYKRYDELYARWLITGLCLMAAGACVGMILSRRIV